MTVAWTDSPEAAVAALARLHPQVLARRLTADKLAVLARALRVRSTGTKARVAAGVVARADLLERMLRLGDDPVILARTFKKASLVLYVKALGGFTGLNKYGLAATLIGRRDATITNFAAAFHDEAAQ